MESSRLRTIWVSSRVMMLMAELLRVMGTPMDSTCRISVPAGGGTSSDGVVSRLRKRYSPMKHRAMTSLTVTPRMAAAAP